MSSMTRASWITSIKITVIYAGGWMLCRHVLVLLPVGFQVLAGPAYLGAAMFWVFRITKHQLTQTAALRLELRTADESFESRVRSRMAELEEMLENSKSIEGIIPICAHCKSIRNGTGNWERIESYIQRHSNAAFSHGLCPDCNEILYGKQRQRIERHLEAKVSETF